MAKLVQAKSDGLNDKKGRKKRFEYSAAETAELKKLGRGIAFFISKSGKSTEKFAYETGLGKGHLSRIVRGQSDIRYCTLRTIAKGLGFKDVPSFLSEIL
jgi:hypothetical protein